MLFLKAAVSAICNPPQPGDESYETFIKVRSTKCKFIESVRMYHLKDKSSIFE